MKRFTSRSRTLLSAVLTTALTLSIGAASLTQVACSDSKAQRLSVALAAASTLPAALNLPAGEQTCAAELFRAASAAVDEYKDHPSGAGWQHVTSAINRLNVGECFHNPRLVAVVTVVQRIFASIQPAGTAAVEGEQVSQTPSLKHVDEGDLKELERLTKH